MSSTQPGSSPQGTQGELVEFRLHGIGKHAEWSALGRPSLLDPPPPATTHRFGVEDPAVRVALPPTLSTRPVYLMNWSRTSSHWGNTVSKLWYVATPYTLVNVARNMRSRPDPDPVTGRPGASRALRALEMVGTHTTGMLLTGLTLVWLAALVETLGRLRPMAPVVRNGWWGPVVVLTVLVLLLGTVYARKHESRIATSAPTLLMHVLTLVATAGLLLLQPSHLLMRAEAPPSVLQPLWSPAPTDVVRAWCTTSEASTDTCLVATTTGEPFLWFFDPLATASLAALAVVSVIALAHYVAGMRSRSPNVTGAGLALAVAMVTFLGFASALRVALEFLVHYLNIFLAGGQAEPFTRLVMPPYWGSVTQETGTQFTSNTLPLYGVAGLLVLVATFAVLSQVAKRRMPASDAHPNRLVVAARARHHLVRNLPTTLAPALLISALVTVGAWALLYSAVTADSPRLHELIIFLLHLTYAAAFLVFLLHRYIGPLDEILGKLADVVGFWPAEHHVFAGISYRTRVVQELDRWMQSLTVNGSVLVAHSQGSVIAAWALAQNRIPQRKVHLVTCGSPLDTLYATFFPAAFTTELRGRLVAAVDGRWRNHWRRSDAIASPCAGCVDNVELPDAPATGRPSGHNNYWNDPEHVQGIDRWLEGVAPAARAQG
ncbi:hypothetical protein [Ornithinimicrobium pekingense]|nr:hypothetical protein [Ornithinimicrobium pekingense]